MTKRRKLPTLEQYQRVLELRRARVPPAVICEIVELPLDDVKTLLVEGLPAKKDKHPAKRPIRAVLIEEHANGVTHAQDWVQSIAIGARQIVAERVMTTQAAAQIERILIATWKAQIEQETSNALKKGKALKLKSLLPGR